MPCKTSPQGPFGTTWGARVRIFTRGFFEEFCVFGSFSISYFFAKEETSNTYLSQMQADTVVKN